MCGPASYVRERLAAYREAGVTVFNVEPARPAGASHRSPAEVAAVTAPDDGSVQVLEAGTGLTELVMNRPERFNALQVGLVSDLHQAFAAVAADRSCRVVVLRGAGRGISAPTSACTATAPGGRDGSGSPQTGWPRRNTSPPWSQPCGTCRSRSSPPSGRGRRGRAGARPRQRRPAGGQTARFNAAFVKVGLSGCDIGVSWLLPRISAPPGRSSSCSPGGSSPRPKPGNRAGQRRDRAGSAAPQYARRRRADRRQQPVRGADDQAGHVGVTRDPQPGGGPRTGEPDPGHRGPDR